MGRRHASGKTPAGRALSSPQSPHQVIEGTDRSVAGKEVVRTGTEADDFQVLQTNDGTCDGHELVDHLSTLSSVTYRLLGDIGAGLAE